MRKVVNISLPEELDKKLADMVKDGGYSTKSEFFRTLLRIKIEEKVFQDLSESRRELALGKGKTLKSLRHLR